MSNATVAAASAFLQTTKSNTSLSSAAAAAALRSHTTSPEPVGSLQTKRMARRGSTTSNGSGTSGRGGAGRPGLQRSNSSGSMTERTFRTATPEEQHTRTMSLDSSAPPVPPIPANAHQRASSLDRTLRVTSSTSQAEGADRMSSLPPTSRTAKRLSGVVESEELERPTSPTSASRNFSRPMSSLSNVSQATGTPKKYTHGTGSWYTQPSTMTAPARPMTAEGLYRPSAPPLDLSSVANAPVSKHRISSAPGSHLARANHGQARSISATSSIPSDDDDYVTVFDKNSRTFIRRPRSEADSPSSPTSPTRVVYDPHTRSLVSKQESARDDSGVTVTPIQSDRVSSPVQRPRIARPAEPENQALQPPTRNSARVSPEPPSPTSPRTHYMLHKQPSVVREDAEAEREAEDASPVSNATRDMVMGGPSKKYTASTSHQRSSSLDVPTADRKVRNTSASPQRAAHFSASPVLQPERHVPPPRSVSPAKSALKHSPASSVRTASPVASFSPPTAASTSTVSPPSETSESVVSQDGLDSGRRKKSVRVSFDERAQEIEVPEASTSPTTTSGAEEDEDDGVMKPRPALPSFGSVRRNRMQPEVAEKVTEMPPERHEASSDHAIGGILRNSLQPLPPEVTSKETSGYASDESSEMEVPAVSSAANPRPAEVGAGLESRREGSEPVIKDFAQANTNEDDEGREFDNADVPAINLLPPTPGIEEDTKKDLSSDQENSFESRAKARSSMEILMPGGWGQDDEGENEGGEASDSKTAMAVPEPSTTELLSTPEDPTAASTPPQDPVLHSSPLQLSDIDEDTDDGAEFSDAVEDVSDLDDEGGFASLDAIVESPIVSPLPVETKAKSRAAAAQDLPESPTKQPVTRNPEAGDPAGADWGEATSYWSQLSRERREQMERAHMSSDDDTRPTPVPAPARNPKPKMPAAGSQQTSLVGRAPAASKQEPTMRKSMRAQPGPAPPPTDDGVHMRRSMRSGGSGGGMTSSLRQGPPPRRPQSEYIEPKGRLQKKTVRPTSAASVGSSSSGSVLQAQRPSSAAGPKAQDSAFPTLPAKKTTLQRPPEPQVSARLQREMAKADDSDSESSFKRRRRGNSGSTLDSTGRYSMRRSMRNGSIDQTPVRAPAPVEQRRPQSPDVDDRGKSSFRFRSLSPFARNKPRAAPPLAGPRTTLRSAPAARQSVARAAPAIRPQPSAPRYKSRFNDSDDSDDDTKPSRSYFRSRFADSDDDEPNSPAASMGLTPVRGIPRRAGQDDGDSTDLDDEEDDDPSKAFRRRGKPINAIVTDPADVEKAMAAARRNLGMSEEPAATPAVEATSTPKATTEGSALAMGSLRTKPEELKEEVPVTRPPLEEPVTTPPEKKKRSFIGRLRRNRNSTSSVQQVRTYSPPPPMPASPATAVNTSTPDAQLESPASPASPSVGKLIRRQSDKPEPRRGNSNFSIATAPPLSSPNTASATQNDEDWPLSSPKTDIPPVPPIPEDLTDQYPNRPNTSDGEIRLPRTMRPDLAPRSKSGPQRVRIQAGEEGSEPGEREQDAGAIYSRRTGKKKKFGMLRRAFGIED